MRANEDNIYNHYKKGDKKVRFHLLRVTAPSGTMSHLSEHPRIGLITLHTTDTYASALSKLYNSDLT